MTLDVVDQCQRRRHVQPGQHIPVVDFAFDAGAPGKRRDKAVIRAPGRRACALRGFTVGRAAETGAAITDLLGVGQVVYVFQPGFCGQLHRAAQHLAKRVAGAQIQLADVEAVVAACQVARRGFGQVAQGPAAGNGGNKVGAVPRNRLIGAVTVFGINPGAAR